MQAPIIPVSSLGAAPGGAERPSALTGSLLNVSSMPDKTTHRGVGPGLHVIGGLLLPQAIDRYPMQRVLGQGVETASDALSRILPRKALPRCFPLMVRQQEKKVEGQCLLEDRLASLGKAQKAHIQNSSMGSR